MRRLNQKSDYGNEEYHFTKARFTQYAAKRASKPLSSAYFENSKMRRKKGIFKMPAQQRSISRNNSVVSNTQNSATSLRRRYSTKNVLKPSAQILGSRTHFTRSGVKQRHLGGTSTSQRRLQRSGGSSGSLLGSNRYLNHKKLSQRENRMSCQGSLTDRYSRANRGPLTQKMGRNSASKLERLQTAKFGQTDVIPQNRQFVSLSKQFRAKMLNGKPKGLQEAARRLDQGSRAGREPSRDQGSIEPKIDQEYSSAQKVQERWMQRARRAPQTAQKDDFGGSFRKVINLDNQGGERCHSHQFDSIDKKRPQGGASKSGSSKNLLKTAYLSKKKKSRLKEINQFSGASRDKLVNNRTRIDQEYQPQPQYDQISSQNDQNSNNRQKQNFHVFGDSSEPGSVTSLPKPRSRSIKDRFSLNNLSKLAIGAKNNTFHKFDNEENLLTKKLEECCEVSKKNLNTLLQAFIPPQNNKNSIKRKSNFEAFEDANRHPNQDKPNPVQRRETLPRPNQGLSPQRIQNSASQPVLLGVTQSARFHANQLGKPPLDGKRSTSRKKKLENDPKNRNFLNSVDSFKHKICHNNNQKRAASRDSPFSRHQEVSQTSLQPAKNPNSGAKLHSQSVSNLDPISMNKKSFEQRWAKEHSKSIQSEIGFFDYQRSKFEKKKSFNASVQQRKLHSEPTSGQQASLNPIDFKKNPKKSNLVVVDPFLKSEAKPDQAPISSKAEGFQVSSHIIKSRQSHGKGGEVSGSSDFYLNVEEEEKIIKPGPNTQNSLNQEKVDKIDNRTSSNSNINVNIKQERSSEAQASQKEEYQLSSSEPNSKANNPLEQPKGGANTAGKGSSYYATPKTKTKIQKKFQKGKGIVTKGVPSESLRITPSNPTHGISTTKKSGGKNKRSSLKGGYLGEGLGSSGGGISLSQKKLRQTPRQKIFEDGPEIYDRQYSLIKHKLDKVVAEEKDLKLKIQMVESYDENNSLSNNFTTYLPRYVKSLQQKKANLEEESKRQKVEFKRIFRRIDEQEKLKQSRRGHYEALKCKENLYFQFDTEILDKIEQIQSLRKRVEADSGAVRMLKHAMIQEVESKVRDECETRAMIEAYNKAPDWDEDIRELRLKIDYLVERKEALLAGKRAGGVGEGDGGLGRRGVGFEPRERIDEVEEEESAEGVVNQFSHKKLSVGSIFNERGSS